MRPEPPRFARRPKREGRRLRVREEKLVPRFDSSGSSWGKQVALSRRRAARPLLLPGNEMRERMKALLSECMERTDDGGWRMSVKFADASALDSVADVLARLAMRT